MFSFVSWLSFSSCISFETNNFLKTFNQSINQSINQPLIESLNTSQDPVIAETPTVNVGGSNPIFGQMQRNERPPSYANDVNSPPPAYAHKTNDNDNSNTEFNETSSYRRLDFEALDSIMNSGGHRPSYNDHNNSNNNNTQSAPRRSESWFERMFQVNTRGYQTFAKVDTQMGNWGIVYIAIQCVAAAILLCVSGVAIKLYQNPWNQSQVIGGDTLSYALAGSILGCVAVRFSSWVSTL
jgi:hypothetical protein